MSISCCLFNFGFLLVVYICFYYFIFVFFLFLQCLFPINSSTLFFFLHSLSIATSTLSCHNSLYPLLDLSLFFLVEVGVSFYLLFEL